MQFQNIIHVKRIITKTTYNLEVQLRFRKCGTHDEQNGIGQLFMEARRFPLPIIHVITPTLPPPLSQRAGKTGSLQVREPTHFNSNLYSRHS